VCRSAAPEPSSERANGTHPLARSLGFGSHHSLKGTGAYRHGEERESWLSEHTFAGIEDERVLHDSLAVH
jgi:hypothetical protein